MEHSAGFVSQVAQELVHVFTARGEPRIHAPVITGVTDVDTHATSVDIFP